MGKYDLVEGVQFKEDFILPPDPIDHYSLNHGVFVDDVFSFFKPNQILGIFKNTIKSVFFLLHEVWIHEKPQMSFEPTKKIKCRRWGYMFYVDSIYFHYFLCFFADLLFGLPAVAFFLVSISYQTRMVESYANIEVLEASSATTAEINAEYSELEDLGSSWLFYYELATVLSLIASWKILHQILVFISMFARQVSLKLLGRLDVVNVLIDLCLAVFSVLNLISYLEQVAEKHDDVRAELRNYRTMLDAYDSNPDIQECAAIIVF